VVALVAAVQIIIRLVRLAVAVVLELQDKALMEAHLKLMQIMVLVVAVVQAQEAGVLVVQMVEVLEAQELHQA
jgi:hypothetical protein